MLKKASFGKSCFISFLLIVGSLALNAQVATASSCPAGWTYNASNFTCTRTFTASVSDAGVPIGSSVQYLVVGGGGGGINWQGSNTPGGDGGQVLTGSLTTSGTVAITIGDGGAANTSGGSTSLSGGASVTASGGLAGGSTSQSGTSSSLSGSAVTYGADGGTGTQGSSGGDGSANSGAGGGGGWQAYGGNGCYWEDAPGWGSKGSQCATDDKIAGRKAYNYSGEWRSQSPRSGGSGVVVLQYQVFAVSGITAATTSPTNDDSFDYTLTFTGPVDAASISANDFTNTGTATGCVFSWTPQSGTAASAISLSVSGCSEGTVIPTFLAGGATSADGVSGPPADVAGTSLDVDRTPPTAPSGVDLADASDNGASNTDNNTNDTTPTMSASGGTNGDTMTISATNGTNTVSCTYVIGSATNCTLPTLTDGTWNISSTLTDPAGNTSTSSSALPITIDGTAPSPSGVNLAAASDTGSSNTDNITNDSTPEISVPGALAGDVVTVSATNGTSTVTCTYTVGAATSCSLPTLSDGIWTLSASVTDAAGNTGQATGSSPITIDGTAPSAPTGLDLLATSDSGASDSDNNTNDTTPTLSASGGTNGDTMTISATNGTTTVSCTYVIGTATNCTLPTLTDGTWNVSSTLTDPAGNTSTSSSALPITIDGTAPSAPSGVDLSASSDSGSSDSDNNTNDATPTLSAAGGANGDTMTISATNGTNTVSCTYVIGSATNCTLPTLTDGTWNISATLTDPLGNESAASSALPVTIATSPPSRSAPDLLATSDNGSSNADNITNDSTPEISIPGALTGDVVTVSATNGTSTVTCTYTVGAATSCSLPTLSDGTWTVSASVTDAAGNTGPSTGSLSMSIDATPPTTPSGVDLAAASDTGESNTDNNTNDTTPTMSATGGANGDTMTISATNGTSTVSCSYVIGSATNCTLPTLTDGTWNISSTLTDPAGNTSTSSTALPITLDTTPPSAPTGVDLAASSDTGASDTDNNTNDTTPTMSAAGGANGDTMTISATNGTSTVSCSYVIGSATNCTLPTLTDGTWNISATLTDTSGNSSPASGALALTIDTLPSSSLADTQLQITTGTNSLTGRIRFAPNAGVHGAAAVVFTVYNTSGKIVSVITRRVKPTEKSASITVRNDGSLSVIRAHTTNKTGVSQSALRGANIMRGKTSAGRLPDGRPLLMGSLLGEVMYFKPNSAALTPRTIALLNQLARTVNSQGGNLFVSGFARKNGIDTPKYLQNLSEQRALAVSMYLSAKGVRLWTTYRGFGAVTTEIGTPAERRVEVRWISVR